MEDKQIINDLRDKGFSGFELVKEALKIDSNLSEKTVFNYLSNNLHTDYLSDEITTLLTDIGRVYKPTSLFDPACGIGRVLSKIDYCDQLYGVDIDNRVIDIAKHFNKKAEIKTSDFLKLKITQKYDQIILTPPFGIRISLENKKEAIEYFFVQKSIRLLNPDGVLIALVPNAFLFSQRFETLRKEILSKYSLEAVIDLKPGTLNNTGVPASVIVIKNTLTPDKAKVYYAKYENNSLEISQNFIRQEGDFWVDRDRINNRIDRSFFDPKYDELNKELYGIEVKELSDLAKITRGASIASNELFDEGEYLFFSGKNIKDGKLVSSTRDKFVKKIPQNFQNAVIKNGDIIVSLIFDENKIYVHENQNIKAIASNNCAIIRSKKYGKYISTYLHSLEGNKIFSMQLDRKRHGVVIPGVSLYDLKQIKIPIVPIDKPNNLFNNELSKEDKYELVSGLIEDQLIKKGWEIKKENRIGNIYFDIGLYINNTLQSFVEIKSPKLNLVKTKEQLNLFFSKSGLNTAFVIQGNNIFQYIDNDFVVLDAFPTISEFLNSKNAAEIRQRIESITPNVGSGLEVMLTQILSELKEIHTTVDEIKEIVTSLQNDFEEIKKENREYEEKLLLLYKKIDRRFLVKSQKLKDEIDQYTDLAKSLITNWNKLEPLSKEYYPLAEYLFSKLQSLPEVDFSPVILQYCRTVENEFLKKLFTKFTRFIATKYENVEDFLIQDLSKDEKGKDKPTRQFANFIKNYQEKTDEDIRYTFGQMHYILQLASSSKIEKQSPLIKEFRSYIGDNFSGDVILSTEYLNEINSIINDFRNKCAHPSKLSFNDAKECKNRIPIDIDAFIDCQKKLIINK